MLWNDSFPGKKRDEADSCDALTEDSHRVKLVKCSSCSFSLFSGGFFLYIEAFSFLFLGWSSFLPCRRPAEQSSYNFTLTAEWVYYFRDDGADFLTLVIWNSLYQDVGYMTDTMESKVKTSTTGIKVHSSLKREVWTRNCVAVAARAVTLSSRHLLLLHCLSCRFCSLRKD